MPVQTTHEMDFSWCVYTDTGIEIPNTRRRSDADPVGPETCRAAVQASFRQECVVDPDKNCHTFLSKDCVRCSETQLGLPMICAHKFTPDATTDDRHRGVCKVHVLVKPEDQAVIDQVNANFQDGFDAALTDILASCDPTGHPLSVLCDYDISFAQDPQGKGAGVTDDYCNPTCRKLSQQALDLCRGKLLPEVQSQIETHLAQCAADEHIEAAVAETAGL